MKGRLVGSVLFVCISLLLVAGCQEELCPQAAKLRMQAQEENLASDMRLQRLREAIDSYRVCQAEAKSEKSRLEIQADVNDLTCAFAEAALGVVAGKPARTIPQSDAIIWKLEQIQAYDDPNGTLQGALQTHQRTRDTLRAEFGRLLELSMKHMDQREWTQAVATANKTLAVDPSSSQAKEAIRNIISTRDAHYTGRVGKSCDQGEWECGEAALAEFRLELPAPDQSLVARLAGRVTETKEKVVRAQATRLLGEQKYYTAYRLIKDANATDCSDLLIAVVDEGTRYYTDLANEEYRNVRDFHAYAAAVKALEMAGSDNDEVFKLHRDCADRVDDSIQINIGVAAFDSLGSEADVGVGFSNELLSYLYERLPYGIRVDERKKIEFALEKVDATEQVVRLLDLKWAIFGDVESSVDSKKDEREVTTWVQVPKMVPNPHYQQELDAVSDKKGKLLPGASKPEAFVMSSSPEQVTYTMGQERLQGQIKLSPRIYSAEEGYLIDPRDFVVTREIEDAFRDEVADANIVGDPLELPTNLIFMQELRRELVKKVADWLLENFGQRQKRFCEEADRCITRREFDLAVQTAVQGYLYCLRDSVPENDAWFRRLRQLALFDLTETPSQG